MKTTRCFVLLTPLLAPLLLLAATRGGGKAARKGKYLVYVGTYTVRESKGVYAYRFDAATGELTSLGLAAETASPSFLAADPSRRFLYAVNEVPDYGGKKSGAVSAFTIDRGHWMPLSGPPGDLLPGFPCRWCTFIPTPEFPAYRYGARWAGRTSC